MEQLKSITVPEYAEEANAWLEIYIGVVGNTLNLDLVVNHSKFCHQVGMLASKLRNPYYEIKGTYIDDNEECKVIVAKIKKLCESDALTETQKILLKLCLMRTELDLGDKPVVSASQIDTIIVDILTK